MYSEFYYGFLRCGPVDRDCMIQFTFNLECFFPHKRSFFFETQLHKSLSEQIDKVKRNLILFDANRSNCVNKIFFFDYVSVPKAMAFFP